MSDQDDIRVTAFVPSITACCASAPGSNRRTAVCISRDVSVFLPARSILLRLGNNVGQAACEFCPSTQHCHGTNAQKSTNRSQHKPSVHLTFRFTTADASHSWVCSELNQDRIECIWSAFEQVAGAGWNSVLHTGNAQEARRLRRDALIHVVHHAVADVHRLLADAQVRVHALQGAVQVRAVRLLVLAPAPADANPRTSSRPHHACV